MLSEIDHQLLHVWGRRLLKRENGSPRIAVVGNCQSFGIAYGMKLLAPHAHVDRFTIVRQGITTLDMLAKTLSSYDHVFSLEFQPGFVRGGGWEELKVRLPNVAPIPSIVFSGFHPDTIAIWTSSIASSQILFAAVWISSGRSPKTTSSSSGSFGA